MSRTYIKEKNRKETKQLEKNIHGEILKAKINNALLGYKSFSLMLKFSQWDIQCGLCLFYDDKFWKLNSFTHCCSDSLVSLKIFHFIEVRVKLTLRFWILIFLNIICPSLSVSREADTLNSSFFLFWNFKGIIKSDVLIFSVPVSMLSLEVYLLYFIVCSMLNWNLRTFCGFPRRYIYIKHWKQGTPSDTWFVIADFQN